MSGEDQGTFEDYLELERYIEEIQAKRPAQPPKGLTPEQVRIYRMVALLRSATPGATELRPEFASSLREQLLALEDGSTLQSPHSEQQTAISSEGTDQISSSMPTPSEGAPTERRGERKRMLFFSRRNLIQGGAVAAASLVAGAGGVAIGAVSQKGTVPKTSAANSAPAASSIQSYPASLALDANVKTSWQPVTTLEELGAGAVRFVTSTLIGYVIRSDGDDKYPESTSGIIAMSAACTHRGCIVQWQDSDRQFHCPCHGGIFTEYGTPATSNGKLHYLDPLPRLETKVEQGQVFVKVPGTIQI